MIRSKFAGMVLVVCFLLLCGSTAWAEGILTLRFEVQEGFSVSIPDNILDLGPVVPEQTLNSEASVTVWSNVPWALYARVQSPAEIPCMIEIMDMKGNWVNLTSTSRVIMSGQESTGADGQDFVFPMRLKSSYGETPGTYSIQLQFTVVPGSP
ncbi:MAG TPA: hypothetical protein GX014_02385 [Firmicutes bacterium]|jgi:hypothetical protein|nr:hypothetical protein [Bacillota bacterium]HHT42237.1 hypothetical protein [Bacillota bacterium]